MWMGSIGEKSTSNALKYLLSRKMYIQECIYTCIKINNLTVCHYIINVCKTSTIGSTMEGEICLLSLKWNEVETLLLNSNRWGRLLPGLTAPIIFAYYTQCSMIVFFWSVHFWLSLFLLWFKLAVRYSMIPDGRKIKDVLIVSYNDTAKQRAKV